MTGWPAATIAALRDVRVSSIGRRAIELRPRALERLARRPAHGARFSAAITGQDHVRAGAVKTVTADCNGGTVVLESPTAVRAFGGNDSAVGRRRAGHRTEGHRRAPARLARHRQHPEARQARRDFRDLPPFLEAERQRKGEAGAAKPSLMSFEEQAHRLGDPVTERATAAIGERPDRHAGLVDSLTRPRPCDRLFRPERRVARRAAIGALFHLAEGDALSGTFGHR